MRDMFKDLWETVIRSNLPGIIAAVVVLIIGWIIALWLSGKAGKIADRCSRCREKIADGEGSEILGCAGKTAEKVVYWAVMIFTILGCMSLLKLEYAAVPLREFITAIARYLPNIAGALLLLLIARITAGVARAAVRKIMTGENASARISEKSGITAEQSAKYSSETAFYIVWLFFLPAILNALGIYGITAPLQAMFEAILVFLPRIAAAALLLFAGLWAAKIIRRAVTGIVEISKLDNFANTYKLGNFSGNTLARLFGITAWVLVVIPVVIAALAVLNISILSATIAGFLDILLSASAKIIGALLIIFAAWAAACIVNAASRRIAEVAGVNNLMQKAGISPQHTNAYPLSVIIGKTVFLYVMLFGALAACEILDFQELAKLIRHFARFGGNIILSAIVLMIGMTLANFAAKLLDGNGGKYFAFAVKTAVIIFTAALALSNLAIGNGIVETAFAMLLGAFCIAFALAFGLGGRQFAGKLLASWQQSLHKHGN